MGQRFRGGRRQRLGIRNGKRFGSRLWNRASHSGPVAVCLGIIENEGVRVPRINAARDHYDSRRRFLRRGGGRNTLGLKFVLAAWTVAQEPGCPHGYAHISITAQR